MSEVLENGNEEQLTIECLDAMQPDKIFASGITTIEHPWFNHAKPVSEGGSLEPDGRSTKVKWAAIRGYIHDWAIYHSLDANFVEENYLDGTSHLKISFHHIVDHGAKMRNEEQVKELVNATDEAMRLYRQ